MPKIDRDTVVEVGQDADEENNWKRNKYRI